MNSRTRVSRRGFLWLSALTAGSAALTACGGKPAPTSTPAPTVAPTQAPVVEVPATTVPATPAAAYKEAPALAKLVQEGKLPPVAERLPKNPLVIKHGWIKPGKYGGVMQWATTFEWGLTYFPGESLYGNSPLRWLRDGLEIGGGTVDRWEMNADATEVTLHWREGLKWSDGVPWTTDDFMYWWEDMVLNPDHPEGPPAPLKSGKGTVAQVTQVDKYTMKFKYDTPVPLVFDQLAIGVKWLFGSDYYGVPRHYLEQFHPKYNSEMKDFSKHDQMISYITNPEMPVTTGWKLAKYEQGQRVIWERNPYYYCVDTEGNQLPYIDSFVNTNYQNGEVAKLAHLEGKVDFNCWPPFGLVDIPTVKESYDRSHMQVRLWNSGTGTGWAVWFNMDYKDPAYLQLFEDKRFRRALSHAHNRDEARKVLYLGFGDLTTGTNGPVKEFSVNDEARRVFAEWRDSAVTYDPALANSLLDELGLKDADGDGLREFPDGRKLEMTLDCSSENQYNEIVAKHWQAVGINARVNPVPPDNFQMSFFAGDLMTYADTSVDDGGSILAAPALLVPVGAFGWAPLQGRYYAMRGTKEEGKDKDKSPWERNPPWREPEPGGVVDRLQKLLDKALAEPDPAKRDELALEMFRIHIEDGPYMIGSVYNLPSPILVKDGLLNVPTREDLDKYALGGNVNCWFLPCPAVYDPECWHFEDPAAHV